MTMTTRNDQSGKIFSHVISKEPVKVKLRTSSAIIEGEIYKKHDERLLDAVNDAAQFIAMTNVKFLEWQDRVEITTEAEFAVINRETIEWLLPLENQA
jgi:hypothetical protein